MEVVFHPEALREYARGVRYYGCIEPQLGQRFHDTLEAVIAICGERPLTCGILERDVHRCVVHTFPYAVLYTVEPDYVLIVAVMPGHGQPGYWRQRAGVQT